jgi:hypothetical protein
MNALAALDCCQLSLVATAPSPRNSTISKLRNCPGLPMRSPSYVIQLTAGWGVSFINGGSLDAPDRSVRRTRTAFIEADVFIYGES